MLTSMDKKIELLPQVANKEEPYVLPAFRNLCQNALALDAGLLAVLLLTRYFWLALGFAAGALVSFAVLWSLHIISRLITQHYQQAEAERRLQNRFDQQPAVRRYALWRFVGMLTLKYAVLIVVMFGIYQLAKGHLIAFMLAFIGGFAVTQLAIVSSAAKAMRTR